MNERQEKVLNTLVFYGKLNIRDLGEKCGYNVNQNKTNHDCCVALRNDIEKINKSVDHPFTIVYDSDYNYWIGKNKEEVVEFIETKKLQPALKKLKSYWAVLQKVKQDNMISYDFDKLEQEIIRAFRG